MIIGLSGLAGCGKDTVADFLVRDRGFIKVALSDPMKEFCQKMFQFSDDQLWGPSAFRNAVDERYKRGSGAYQGFLTPRLALQTLGTEWGRNCYEDVWIDYAIRKGQAITSRGNIPGIVIPDVRFKNEMDRITKAGGTVWRIVRPGAGLEGEAAAHASENGLTDKDCSVVINNDRGISDLRGLVRQIPL